MKKIAKATKAALKVNNGKTDNIESVTDTTSKPRKKTTKKDIGTIGDLRAKYRNGQTY